MIVQASSSRLCNIDSLMRLISFLPLYSPCFRLILEITFFHPAYWLNFLYDYLSSPYFLMFYLDLSSFSCSFRFKNSSSCFLPSCLREFFSSYSFCCLDIDVHFSSEDLFEFFPIILEYDVSSRLPQNR